MKILLHDYSGHAFTIQLSRALARRGHCVLHAYFNEVRSPRGAVPRSDDPAGLTIRPLSLDMPFQKYNPVKRALQERQYGRKLAALVAAENPDILIQCNTPDDVLDTVLTRMPRGIKVLWWVQDIYADAIVTLLKPRLGLLASLAGWVYRRIEARMARAADSIVVITEDFIPQLTRLGAERGKIAVIENWAALDGVTPVAHDNDWKREQGLSGKKIILYSGTLGLKHDAKLFVDLAAALKDRDRNDVRVLVVSEGLGAQILREQKQQLGLDNLIVLPWQPYERLSEVLSTGDVMVACVDPGAGEFSVPSKVLAYLCAGRPIVASMPRQNLAARTILRADAGLAVSPGDRAAFLEAVLTLLDDAEICRCKGANARAYAEKAFNIEVIADRFEQLLGVTR